MRTVRLGVLIAALVTSISANAFSAADDAKRSAARNLGYDGVTAFEKGDYVVASDKLERAFKVVRVPTLGLWLARALVKTGKFVEASERYAEVIRMDATGTGSQAQAQFKAQSEATEERQLLITRIPNVRLVIRAAELDRVEAKIDGVVVPPALFGVPCPVNPGPHTIAVSYAGRDRSEKVSLVEGASKDVVIEFDGAAAPAASAKSSEPVWRGDPHQNRSTDQSPSAASWSWQKTAGVIGLGVGALGVIVGSVTGVMVLKQRSSVSNDCPSNDCPPAAWDKADNINTLRTVSTVGFITAGIALAAGTTFLLTAPKQTPSTAGITPWVSLTSAGLTGSF